MANTMKTSATYRDVTKYRVKNLLYLLCLPIIVIGQQNDSTKLSRYMDAFRSLHDFNGTVLAVKNDKPVFTRSFGFADPGHSIPNSTDTKFRIGSCSKQFTAISILQLQEQGKLSVKDKLSKFFPDFPASDIITIEMLLANRSGLNDFYQTDKYERLNSPSLTKEKIIELIRTCKLDFPPGTKYAYSNPGYFILGLIIEKASGVSFDEYITTNIFSKANMHSSGVDHNETDISNKATGFVPKGKGLAPAPFDNMACIQGCGNLYSTANDIQRYFYALKENILLSEKSRELLLTPLSENVMYGGLPLNGMYAFGLMIDTIGGHHFCKHGGWCYGFKSDISMFFQENVLVIVLSNYESDVWSLARGIQAVLFNVQMEYPRRYKEVSIKPKMLEKFAGQYGRIKIYMKGSHLYLINTVGDSDRIKLIPESETRFSFEGENDRQLEFSVDNNGKVVGSWLLASGVKYALR
jgi:CubicO group peptidase (beta-lactamase class C family)